MCLHDHNWSEDELEGGDQEFAILQSCGLDAFTYCGIYFTVAAPVLGKYELLKHYYNSGHYP
jgi:hypothetical protein